MSIFLSGVQIATIFYNGSLGVEVHGCRLHQVDSGMLLKRRAHHTDLERILETCGSHWSVCKGGNPVIPITHFQASLALVPNVAMSVHSMGV